jgi:hypothetical protein
MEWTRILAYITGTVGQELLLRNEYLAAENRVLRAQLKGRLRLSDAERATLGEIGSRLGRKALGEVANAALPDTILASPPVPPPPIIWIFRRMRGASTLAARAAAERNDRRDNLQDGLPNRWRFGTTLRKGGKYTEILKAGPAEAQPHLRPGGSSN